MAVLEDKECCNSCLFFVNGERMGICKRFPSAVNKSNDDWCGEWRIAESEALEALVQQIIEPISISLGTLTARDETTGEIAQFRIPRINGVAPSLTISENKADLGL